MFMTIIVLLGFVMKRIIQLLAPELDPPPNYLRMKYLTPLHKMVAIMFYCNFMFATSSVSSTSNVPTANDIAAGLQGMQQLQNAAEGYRD